MIDYLYKLSDISMFIFISIASIVLSILIIIIINYFVTPQARQHANSIISTTSSLISIIFGVFTSLMALYLINNINFTADAVQKEADALANIYRDSNWLKDPTKTIIRKGIVAYLYNNINIEWPQMKEGKPVTSNNDDIINNISDSLAKYTAPTSAEIMIMDKIVQEIKALYDSRHWRLYMNESKLNPEVWLVIFVGTILTLGINYLFGTNFYVHLVTIIAAALMCSSMIYILIALDKPFQGDFVIKPKEFEFILSNVQNK